jgi:uncharacterized membrane protein
MAEITKKEIEEGKFWALVSYFWIIFVISLLVAKENKFALYHAKQGFVLFIFSLIVIIISAIPIIGWILGLVGTIALIVLFIIGIINVLSNKCAPLPYIGKYAKVIKI